VFTNLLTNAAKYTPAGGDIWIDAWGADAGVCIAVRDNGIGIAPDAVSRIFELFTRDRTAETRSTGLGIGLAIVKHSVELHNGTVTVRSPGTGKGATVELCLPPAMAEAPAHPPVPESVIQPAGQSQKVLVVDDNEDAALTLMEVLRALGHVVQMAFDPVAAIRLASNPAMPRYRPPRDSRPT